MATEVEPVVSEGGGEVVAADDYDPHAECRIDKCHYLVIEEIGKYRVSYEPKEIPKDVVVEAVAADKCRVGIRHFKVRKADMNTYDLVSVGTITVQNGYAYIAGLFIHEEGPDLSNEYIIIPPFVITYPLELPVGKDLEKYGEEIMQKVHSHLKDELTKCGRFGPRLHDFDLNKPYHIYQPNRCQYCDVEMYEGGFDFCDMCDYGNFFTYESDVSSSINHEGCEDDKVETHKASMDIDDHDGEDSYHELGKLLGNCDLVN